MRRAKYGLTFLGLVVPFLILIAHELYRSWQVAKSDVRTETRNLSQMLAVRLNAEFSQAEKTVEVLVKEIDPDLLQPQRAARAQKGVARWLHTYSQSMATASAVRIFDAAGNRIYTSMEGEHGTLNIADRGFFRELRQAPTATKAFYSDVLFRRFDRAVYRAVLDVHQ